MFVPNVGNPFTGKDRRARRDEEIYERHRKEREQREDTREAAYQDTARLNKNFKGIDERSNANKSKNLAERAKYQFEADDEDDQLEDEIDSNLDALSGAAGRLNLLARGKSIVAVIDYTTLTLTSDGIRSRGPKQAFGENW